MEPTLRTVSGRHVLRLERRLAHPPEKVWRALTDPAQLAAWFPAAVRWELRVGGVVDFDADGDAPSTGELLVVDPPSTLAFTWDGDVVRFELRADAAGTVLALEHTFDDRPAAASYGAGWLACLAALDALLDGNPAPQPASPAAAWSAMHAAHEALVAALGLDQGTVQESPDGWRVQFARQLTRPVAQVWALLGGAEAATGGPVPAGSTAPGVQPATVTAAEAPARLVQGGASDGGPRPGEEPVRLAYGWRAGGRVAGEVSLALSEGPGGAARLVLTQTGPADLPEARTACLRAWQARIRALSDELGGLPGG